MASDDDPKQPNPAFLRTRMLGSRSVNGLDYDDEAPTGVEHKPSNRPKPHSAPPARIDPNDVYMLTEPPARQDLPSFADTVVGPGSLETPRTDLPPVRVSPLAHSPTPPPPGAVWPTPPSPPIEVPQAPAFPAPSSPPLMRAPRQTAVWKPIRPPPRYLSRPPVAKPITPTSAIHGREPPPVEDRLLNAIVVLVIGVGVALGATWAFLTVTHTRAPALSDFITNPTSASQP